MQPGDGERSAGLDLARDRSRVERSFGAQRHAPGAGLGAIAVFQRRLQGAEFVGVHVGFLVGRNTPHIEVGSADREGGIV